MQDCPKLMMCWELDICFSISLAICHKSELLLVLRKQNKFPRDVRKEAVNHYLRPQSGVILTHSLTSPRQEARQVRPPSSGILVVKKSYVVIVKGNSDIFGIAKNVYNLAFFLYKISGYITKQQVRVQYSGWWHTLHDISGTAL